MRSAPKPRIATLLLATMLTLPLLAACGQAAAKPVTAAPTATPNPIVGEATPQPGAPPVPGKPLSWHRANLPVGFGLSMHFSDLQVAASDGTVAYSCMTPGTLQGKASAPQVIVTHDAGATWAATARIAATWNVCDHLVIDQLNPAIVIAYGYSNAGEQAAMSVDGGESWRMLATNGLDEMKQATIGSRTWALLSKQASGGPTVMLAERASPTDTWREIDGALASKDIRDFWINPGTGALLLLTYANWLWVSSDDGAHWAPLSLPARADTLYPTVQRPVAHQPWRICTMSLDCTMDGGRTWAEITLPDIAPNGARYVQLADMADDGAVLMVASPDGRLASAKVYRLPVGASRWQALGTPPQDSATMRYVSSPLGGILWMFPAESDGAGAPGDPRAIYSAAYPY